MRHLIGFVFLAACSSKAPAGDWEKTRWAYCNRLDNLKTNVELDFTQALHTNIAPDDGDCATAHKLFACHRLDTHIDTAMERIAGFTDVALAVRVGAADPATAGIVDIEVDLELWKELRFACTSGSPSDVYTQLGKLRGSTLARIDRAIEACAPYAE